MTTYLDAPLDVNGACSAFRRLLRRPLGDKNVLNAPEQAPRREKPKPCLPCRAEPWSAAAVQAAAEGKAVAALAAAPVAALLVARLGSQAY